MLVYKISDAIVFNALRNIKHGYLEIIKINGQILKFGDPNDNLKASLQIKDESLTYNLIKSAEKLEKKNKEEASIKKLQRSFKIPNN